VRLEKIMHSTLVVNLIWHADAIVSLSTGVECEDPIPHNEVEVPRWPPTSDRFHRHDPATERPLCPRGQARFAGT
jgi:hypothetical protein